MQIQVDSREKSHAIGNILRHFDENGIQHFVSKLPVGDYISLDNARLSIDRKANLQELCTNIAQDHTRFITELYRATSLGIRLIILCEHGPSIKTLEDVRSWENPRLRTSPRAMTGEKLYKAIRTISCRHGVEFFFCNKSETGAKIVELLGGERNG